MNYIHQVSKKLKVRFWRKPKKARVRKLRKPKQLVLRQWYEYLSIINISIKNFMICISIVKILKNTYFFVKPIPLNLYTELQ